jgi:hypothetical protein
MSATVTVFVKNMGGDVLPLNVSSHTTLPQIAQQLSLVYPEYPASLTQLFRFPEGEEKESSPVEEGTVLVAVVRNAPVKETGFWSIGGQPYIRFAFPFRGRTLYIYPIYSYDIAWYALTFQQETTKLSAVRETDGSILYNEVSQLVPDVTPQEMSEFYEVLIPYYKELSEKTGRVFRQEYRPKEPLVCECGSVVQRSSMSGHVKTKKHREWVKSQ